MKKRLDFVSNSSSSSFIVIADGKLDEKYIGTLNDECKSLFDYNQTLPIPNKLGTHQFGWSDVQYSSFLDKLNFVALQLCYMLYSETYEMFHPEIYDKNTKNRRYVSPYKGKFAEFYKMLYDVCLETAGLKIILNKDVLKIDGLWEGSTKNMRIGIDCDFYIDHQSTVSEESCMEMFESKDALKSFLFNENSYVNTGNDNG